MCRCRAELRILKRKHQAQKRRQTKMAKLFKANKDEISQLKSEKKQLKVKIDHLKKANIQDLQKKFEELLKYSYNVDKFLFPPPENLKEHFKTVKGSCEFIEENAKIHPFFIPPTT